MNFSDSFAQWECVSVGCNLYIEKKLILRTRRLASNSIHNQLKTSHIKSNQIFKEYDHSDYMCACGVYSWSQHMHQVQRKTCFELRLDFFSDVWGVIFGKRMCISRCDNQRINKQNNSLRKIVLTLRGLHSSDYMVMMLPLWNIVLDFVIASKFSLKCAVCACFCVHVSVFKI